MIPVLAQLAGWFTLPWLAVAGVVCVGLPVAVHLWSRSRRRRADWGAMRFLQLAYRKQRRRLQMERWVLLAARCLLVVLAGLALAGPLVGGGVVDWISGGRGAMGAAGAAGGGGGGGGERGGRVVHVVLDDALGSRGEWVGGGGEMSRWERRRGLASAVIASARTAGDDVVVWRTSRGADVRAAGGADTANQPAAERWSVEDGDRAEAGYGASRLVETLTAVRSAVESGSSRVGSERGGGVREGGQRAEGGVVVVIGGFERGVAALGEAVPAALAGWGELVQLVVSPAEVGGGNVQIESIGVAHDGGQRPGQVGVDVTLRRWGGLEREAAGRLVVGEAGGGGSFAGARQGDEGAVVREARFGVGRERVVVNVELPVVMSGDGGGGVGAADRRVVVEARLEMGVGVADAVAEDNVRWAVAGVRNRLEVGVVGMRGAGNAEREGGSGPEWGAEAFIQAVLSTGGTRVARTWSSGEALNRGEQQQNGGGEAGPAESDGEAGGLDGVVVLRPDEVGVRGWERLGDFARGGGVVWVFAPGGRPGEATPNEAGGEAGGTRGGEAEWFGWMRSAMEVSWMSGPGAEAYRDKSEAGVAGGGGWRVDVGGRVPGSMSMLLADWEALWGPVRATRRWPVGNVEAEQAWVRWAGDGRAGAVESSGDPAPQAAPVAEAVADAEDRGPGVVGDGGVLLASARVGAGRLVWMGLSVDPSWTNLGTKPVFPAVMHDVLRRAVKESGSRTAESWA